MNCARPFRNSQLSGLKIPVKKESPSVSVIGDGTIGSWTALHLAESGVRTTGRSPLPELQRASQKPADAGYLLA